MLDFFRAVPAMLLRCIREVCMVSLLLDCRCEKLSEDCCQIADHLGKIGRVPGPGCALLAQAPVQFPEELQ